MKDLLRAADEIAKKMKEQGYEYFNVKFGAAGCDFSTGIASYLRYASINDKEPDFPIYAVSTIAATSPDHPFTRATFKIVEDDQKGLRVDAMSISMYECHDGPLRTGFELEIKALKDIPSRADAAMLMEEKWEALKSKNNIGDMKAYDLRVNKGKLPTVEIAGHTFYVDLRMDKLRPKDDFFSNGIVFSDIQNYYNPENKTYTIPYNPKTHEFQEPDYKSLKDFPKDLIAISFPSERILDRIGWNRKHGFGLMDGLSKNAIKLQFASKQIPWEKTFLVDLIKSNVKTEAKLKQAAEKQQPNKPNTKGRKI